VPVLSDVVVIFLSSVVVLTPSGNFLILPLLRCVSDIIDCSMVDQMVTIWEETVVAESRYSLRIYLEVMRKAMENFGQYTRGSGRDSNWVFPPIQV
jgi:hypothetical protein